MYPADGVPVDRHARSLACEDGLKLTFVRYRTSPIIRVLGAHPSWDAVVGESLGPSVRPTGLV